MQQIPFSFPPIISQDGDDFFVTKSHEAAVAYIQKFPHWVSHLCGIVGPKFSGKTHLSRLWQEKTKARLLPFSQLESYYEFVKNEGTQPIYLICKNYSADLKSSKDEEKLFHFLNEVLLRQDFVIFLDELDFSRWPVKLPDLASRLKLINPITIAEPQDDLIKALYVKFFMERQISVSPEVIEYLGKVTARSFSQIHDTVEKLDQLSLSEKKKISIPLIKRFLGQDA